MLAILAKVARCNRRSMLWLWLVATVLLVGLGLAVRQASAHRAAGQHAGDQLTACLTRARPGDTPEALLAQPARFDCRHDQSAYGPGNFWLRLTVAPGQRITGQMNQFSFLPSWQGDATLYALLADGRLLDERLDNLSLAHNARVGGRVAAVIENDGVPVRTVLLHIEQAVNPVSLIDAPQLLTPADVDRTETIEAAIYASFGGVCLALLVSNLAMWLPVRARFQGTYCLMLVAMLTYGWAHAGLPPLQASSDDITLDFRLVYASLGLSAALSVRFFIDFLEAETLSPALRLASNAQVIALLVTTLGVSSAPIAYAHQADTLYIAAYVPLPLITTAIIFSAMLRGSRSARLMLLAWLVPACLAIWRLAYMLGVTRFTIGTFYAPLLAMCIEALLSSLAVAMRVRRIVEERDAARAEERFARQQARSDPLTGLLNRRGLLESAACGLGGDMRLMLVDIDHFKQINDTHGHDVGDVVLCDVGSLLHELAGHQAHIARLGGEEFALLGRAADLSPAQALAILARVRGHAFACGARLTVSIGMARGPLANDAHWARLYRRADQALYEAKNGGRNRAVDEDGLEHAAREAANQEPGNPEAASPLPYRPGALDQLGLAQGR